MIITIPASCEGRLLRSYLQLTLGLSTTTLSRLKKDERGILVNGAHVTVRYVLHAGDVLSLALDDTADTATETVLPCSGPLDVLFEDASLIVLNKPAGTPTHPSHGHLTDTLANALAFRYAGEGVPFVFRPLGRLDRNTSGVVVCGKTQAVAGFLGGCLKERTVVKRYIALLDGEMQADEQVRTIDLPILQPAAGVKMRTVCDPGTPGAEEAHSTYRVLCAGGGHTLVLASPLTGRTHQLRVHFAALGHPITGDDIYGTPSPLISRHALHCASLSLPVPFFAAAAGVPPDAGAPVVSVPDVSAPVVSVPVVSVPVGPARRGLQPMRPLSPDTPLNIPSPDGWLHTWAPMPDDMEAAIEAVCPGSTAALTARKILMQ